MSRTMAAMMRNRRIVLFLVAMALVGLGLGIRRFPSLFHPFVTAYLPDIAWAALVYVLIAFLAPGRALPRVGLIAIAVALAIELSQLYHAPWIDAVRHTRLGGLLLGYGFLWSDVICYMAGVAAAASIDWLAQGGGRQMGTRRS